jgi:hypothetical protein
MQLVFVSVLPRRVCCSSTMAGLAVYSRADAAYIQNAAAQLAIWTCNHVILSPRLYDNYLDCQWHIAPSKSCVCC